MRLLAASLAAALALSGCVAFNEDCTSPVKDPNDITGYLSADVSTTKNDARGRDNAIGQLVAESYFHAFDGEKEENRPDLGLENSGSIRNPRKAGPDGSCEETDLVPKGPVKRKTLREVLPFDDTVVMVTISWKQLKDILEHSVAGFLPTGQANKPGSFLQLYGGTVAVDCNLPAEDMRPDLTRKAEGKRVTRITLKRRDGTAFDLPLDDPAAMEHGTVRVALNSFVAQGNDGFIDFKSVDPSAVVSAGSFNFEIVASYFAKNYPKEAPLGPPEKRVDLNSACK